MKNIFYFLLILFSSLTYSQTDYLITLKGDTIHGEISISSQKFYDLATVKTESGKREFKSFLVHAVSRDGLFLDPVSYENKQVFAQRLILGPVSLYLVKTEGSPDYNQAYLVKSTGKALVVPNISFRKITAEFFEDCDNIASRIESKELGKNEIEQIVTDYNKGCDPSIPANGLKLKNSNKLLKLYTIISSIEDKKNHGKPVPKDLINALEDYKTESLNNLIDSYLGK